MQIHRRTNYFEGFFYIVLYLHIILILYVRLTFEIQQRAFFSSDPFFSLTLFFLTFLSGVFVFLKSLRAQKTESWLPIFKKNWFYVSVFMLFLIVFLAAGNFSFGTNDDWGMMSVVSGIVDGKPDGHLVFTNILMGELLRVLYLSVKGVSWYAWYLIITLSISSFVILRGIFSYFDGSLQKTIALLIFFIFIPKFFYTLNFTSTAILSSFSGICLLIQACTLPSKKGRKIIQYLGGILLIFIGGLIRFSAMGLVGVLLSPVLVYLIVKAKKSLLFYSLLISLILSFGAFFIDNRAYQADPEWNKFKEYNIERGAIHGTPKLVYDEENSQFWEQIGWGHSGFEMFKYWFFIDNDVFTLESLKEINSTYKYSSNNIKYLINFYINNLSLSALECLSFLMILFIFIYYSREKSSQKRWIDFSLLFMALIVFGIMIGLRMPNTLFLPILFIITIYILAATKNISSPEFISKRPIPFHYLIPLLITLLFFQSASLISLDIDNLSKQIEIKDLLHQVETTVQYTDQPFVIIDIKHVYLEWKHPLASQEIPFTFVATGWLINSPPYNHVLDEQGIDNLIESIYEKPNIYLFGRTDDMVITYLSDIKNINVQTREMLSVRLTNMKLSGKVKLVRLELIP